MYIYIKLESDFRTGVIVGGLTFFYFVHNDVQKNKIKIKEMKDRVEAKARAEQAGWEEMKKQGQNIKHKQAELFMKP